MWEVLLKADGEMTGDDEAKAKICTKCGRIVLMDALLCPSCGGIIFETVDLGGANE